MSRAPSPPEELAPQRAVEKDASARNFEERMSKGPRGGPRSKAPAHNSLLRRVENRRRPNFNGPAQSSSSYTPARRGCARATSSSPWARPFSSTRVSRSFTVGQHPFIPRKLKKRGARHALTIPFPMPHFIPRPAVKDLVARRYGIVEASLPSDVSRVELESADRPTHTPAPCLTHPAPATIPPAHFPPPARRSTWRVPSPSPYSQWAC
jgi:hypothetical protein